MASRIGMSTPLHSTAIGKAILAELPEDEVREICARTGLPRRTPQTLTSVTALRKQLVEIRKQGYALDDGENKPGPRCVGAPVLSHEGKVIGAVSISTLEHDLALKAVPKLGAEVARTACEVSGIFGVPAA